MRIGESKTPLARSWPLIGLLALMVPQRGPAQEATPQLATDDGAGRIDVEGRSIETMVLESKTGRAFEVERPASSLQLPAGEYRVGEVVLEGSYVSSEYSDWFAVDPGTPHVLKIGAPLVPQVSASHFGRLLTINYDLVGAGGRSYRSLERSPANQPRFVVLKDNQEIASGLFEYG
jgi:hypothetical protein